MKPFEMKAKLLIAAITLTLLAGCSKDKFTTKPQLTFKSVNLNTIEPGQVLSFTIRFTDKEGDIQNALYFDKKTRNCSASDVSQSYTISQNVPKTGDLQGDLLINFAYGQDAAFATGYPLLPEPQCGTSTNPINDTCVFRFVLTDKANNSSDTLVSPEIVIIKR